MKKRILSILLCCVMLAGLLPTVALADEGVTFTAITGTTGANDNEGYAKLFDGNSATKWCVTNFTSAYVIFKASEAMAVTGYSITTGNDNATNPGRNPENWTLYGYTGSGEPNSSSTAWESIHSVTNDTDLKDKNLTAYNFYLTETAPAYQYFKLVISAIESGKVMQMSEFTLTSCDHEWDEGTVTAPTCTIKGYTEYTCTKCGNTKIANETAPLGHDFPSEDGACTHCKKTRAELYTFDVSKGRVMIADDEYSGKLLVYYFTQEDGLQRAEGYIDPSETITVTGSTTVNELHVVTTTPVTIKAKDLTIDRYETSWAYAMSLDTSGADVTLILEGTNVFKGGSGRAGISVGAGRTLTIQGDGSLTATGRGNGAGIGGDAESSCGTIIINSGTVTANGGEGIGKGMGSGGIDTDSGSFSTGENGSAVIFANYSIGDKSRQDSWSGIIFEGGTGRVYGTPTLTTDLTIPAGKSLTIPAGKSLTIPENVTLKISPGATLTNSGAIYVDGTLSGTVGGTVYYPLTLTNCTASPVSNNNNKTYAAVGTSVILTADRPEFFQSWDITGAEGSASGSSYTITMPAGKVTARANLSADAPTYTVTINAGENMSLSSGKANQSDLSGAMAATVYTAADGYYFPTDYAVEEVNGISVTRNSYTQITVSGTPTANTAITLAPATAKTKEDTPTATFDAQGPDFGNLNGISQGIKYSLDGGITWTEHTSSDTNKAISGVSADKDIKVCMPASDSSKLDSDIQTIDVTKSATPTGVIGVACTTSENNNGKLRTVTTEMQYKKSDADESSWTDCGGTEVTGLSNGIYYVRVKASGTVLASNYLEVTVAAYVPPHTHCACGGNTDVGDHTTHTDVTYQPWDGTSVIDYGDDNTAYVCLTNDVTIQSNLEITGGKTLYLCLNGKTFASNGTTKIVVRDSHLILCDCASGGTIDGADSGWGGTGIYLYNSTMDMYGGKITGGNASGNGGGGAIALDDVNCVFNMYGGEISGNKANRTGGAIFLNGTLQTKKGGTVNLYGGTIKNNRAQIGGAIYAVYGGTVNLFGGEISGNTATAYGGGAICLNHSGVLNMTGGKMQNNMANTDGGAVNLYASTFTFSGGTISNNDAGDYGGAIYLSISSTLTMTGGEICNNTADAEGGAVHVYGKNSTFNLSSGKITGNEAVDGGAVYLNQENSTLNMTGGEISGNKATGNGGAVYMYRATSTLNLSGGTIKNNTADSSGGAVYFNTTSDGKIQGILNISGNPVVKDNTVSDKANNIAMKTGKTLSIVDAMTDGASVGITTESTDYPVVFSNAYGTDYSGYFFADDENAHVNYNSEKKLELAADVPAHTHSWATAWSKNDTHHWHECTAEDCDVTDNAGKQGYGEHSFTAEKAEEHYLKSEATCTAKATYYKSCICGAKGTETFESGEIDADNHTDTTEWIQTATMHTQKYKCCDAIVVAEENHEWENGVCTECEYVCQHSGGEATCKEGAECDICGEIYGEPNPENHSGNMVWITNETQHEKKWDCCGETVIAPETHTIVDGKCEMCGYIAGHTHSLTKVDAKPATATEDGNKEYYICDGCDKWFEDENGTTEITDKSSVTVPATGSSEDPTDPTDPGDDDDLRCPFLRWLRDTVRNFVKWFKNVSAVITDWFRGVFDNINSAFNN